MTPLLPNVLDWCVDEAHTVIGGATEYERQRAIDELATLHAHSAALRTIAEKAPRDWWKRGTYTHEWGAGDECIGCEAVVNDDGTCAHATGCVCDVPCAGWCDDPCWAAPIIAMMEGMVET